MTLFKAGRKYFTAVFCFALVFALCGCAKSVEFENGKQPLETTELSMVLQPGETALLDQLGALTYADLSGSENFDEIAAWAKAHPQVDVRYTLTFPDGTVADNKTSSLDLSGLSAGDVEEAVRLLAHIEALEELVLMPGAFTPEQVVQFAEATGLEIEYSYQLAGQSVDLYAESVDLSMLGSEDMQAALELLPALPELHRVNLGTQESQRLSWDDIYALVQACPELDFDYDFSIYGKNFSLGDKEMDLNHIALEDGGEQAFYAARCMKNLEYLDMDSCGVSNEAMEKLRDNLPGVKVVWRIWFGSAYSVRTDVEKILASKPSVGGMLGDKDVQVLRYCTDVKYIDLGHNMYLTDISFAAYMPKLEAVILAMNQITDLSPLANCPELEYLEIQTNEGLWDLSPLASCPKLAHLNVARCRNLADISPLFGLTNLERLWLGSGNGVPKEQVEEFMSRVPGCQINTSVFSDPTEAGWRITDIDIITWIPTYAPRYELLMEQFGYAQEDYSFYWKDPKY